MRKALCFHSGSGKIVAVWFLLTANAAKSYDMTISDEKEQQQNLVTVCLDSNTILEKYIYTIYH